MKRWISLSAVIVSFLLAWPSWLSAAVDPRSASATYSVNEATLGTMGDYGAASAGYKTLGIDDGGSTLGDIAVGDSASTTYQSKSGTNTTNSPVLSMTVNTSVVSFGILSTGAKSTATATFNVKDYTSYGYAVTVLGSAPTYDGYSLASLATDTASTPGTEQFGINTVLNSSAAVGADPVQVPNSNFSFGVAGDGATGVYGTSRPYTVSDKWRYNAGEIIASAPKSSGETDYTITFLANILATTPAGIYNSAMTIVATGQY